MRALRRILLVLTSAVLLPAAAYAQASIAGTVKDSSGAVLPGVTVEASSPELIERVRTATTDGTGQYRIVDLRPGTYSVTFTLTGFSSFKREGIELTGSFSATVNADLKVGTVTETVTVAGETPIVDVQNVRRQETLSNDVLSAIPTARAYHSIVALIPGMNMSTQDVGGIAGPATVTFSIHGGRPNEGHLQVDGVSVGAAVNGGGVSYYVADVGNAQEITFTTSGGLGEGEVSGPVMSIVPKQGGNSLKGTWFANGATDWMGGTNVDPALVRDVSKASSVGVTQGNTLLKIWDLNGVLGGPIVKDQLWFFAGDRYQGNRKQISGMFYNVNAGDPAKWLYVADPSRPAKDDGTWKSTNVRLTWQASPRNKLNFFWDEQTVCSTGCIYGGSATTAPEARGRSDAIPQRVQTITWTSPRTSKLLLEAGMGSYRAIWGGQESNPNPTHDLPRMTEQCTVGCAANGNIANLTYHSQNWAHDYGQTWTWRASASYITGAHSMKIGYTDGWSDSETQNFTNTTSLSYRVNNGVPNQLTESGLNGVWVASHTKPVAVYAQDQSTFGRLTVQGGVRWDHSSSNYPAQPIGPTRFIPSMLDLAAADGVTGYNDITPRMGVAYDLTGDGKTSLKVNLGKYVQAATNEGIYSALNPSSRVTGTVTRTWTDRNGNWIPDCDLLNPLQQSTTTDFCGQISDLNLGKQVFTTNYDPVLRHGWGIRASDWSFGASVTREVLPRTSVEVGYFRRWFNGFLATDNINQAASDFSTFSLTAPLDPRLPGGGGYVISGLYNVNNGVASNVNNLVQQASNFGNQYQHFNGVDLSFNTRMKNGVTFQGGTSTGQTVTDNCEIKAKLPESGATNPYCHTATGFITQFRGLGSYTVPRVDVQFSATFQSLPGPSLSATYSASNAEVKGSLGRDLSNSATSVSVNLLAPGSMYGDRLNQLDLRIAKILRIGRTRTNVGVDFYNAFNSAAVQTYNGTFVPGGTWPVPTAILPARFAKVSMQLDF